MFKKSRNAFILGNLIFAGMLLATGPVNAQDLKPRAKSGEVVVYFPKGTTETQVAEAAEKAGCTVLRPIPYSPGYYVFKTKSVTRTVPATSRAVTQFAPIEPEVDNAVKVLMATPGVLANANWLIKPLEASPRSFRPYQQPPTTGNATFIPNDPVYNRQTWHMQMIRMPEAWEIQSDQLGRPVIVAVSDTGLDLSHPDFQGNVVNPRNVVSNPPDANVTDLIGHGTHVAGTVAALTNNGIGVTGVAGLQRNGVRVNILPIRIFNNPGDVDAGAVDSTIAAFNYSVEQGADVHNCSWGPADDTNPPQNPTLEQAVRGAVASGMVVVAAAGNSNVNTPGNWPGSYDGVIRVSSVGPTRRRASYSNFGPRIAIAAPGGDGGSSNNPDDVWSTVSTGGVNAIQQGGATVGGYNGTSMASPHVAGVAALLIANGCPRGQVRQQLQSTAQLPFEGYVPVTDPNGSSEYGAGIVDAYAAILPFANPPFQVNLVGSTIRPTTYTNTLQPFTIQARGVTNNAPPVGQVVIDIQTATLPSTTVRTLREGTDFPAIPRTLGTGEVPATVFTRIVPGDLSQYNLSPGRYKAVLRVGETQQSFQFFDVLQRIQTRGRAMFSVPFRVREVSTAQPEVALFGAGATFTLARYNPLRLPSDFDYALFQSSGGRQDPAASFRATAPDGSPIVYEISAPNVNIAPVGLGYWLNLAQTTPGTPQGVPLNTVGPEPTNSVAIRLFASGGGWNMIGTPFTQPIAWGTVTVRDGEDTYSLTDAVLRGLISPALVGYSVTQNDYSYSVAPGGNLEPFNAYWVRAYRDLTLIVPPAGTTRSATPAVPVAFQKPKGWQARLIARVAGDQDGQNYFGQVNGAKEGSDLYDIPKPPSGSGHAYLHFVTKADEGRSVANAFDLRPLDAKGKQEWTAVVSTDRTNADVTVTWDKVTDVPRRATLTLTDTVTGKTVNMRSGSSYTFRSGESGSTRQFKITLNPQASGGPLAISNVSVTSSRSTNQGGLTVRFTTTADAEIRGVVKALNGTVVSNLSGATRAVAGNQTVLRWDGRSRSGAMVPPGPYLIELTAQGSDGQTQTFNQPFQNIQ